MDRAEPQYHGRLNKQEPNRCRIDYDFTLAVNELLFSTAIVSDEPNDMNSTNNFRSPLLMNADDTAVVVVDLQEKLVPLINHHRSIIWNIGRLLDGAEILNVKTCGTEQYPRGLGPTIEPIAGKLAKQSTVIPDKMMFSCRECNRLFESLSKSGIHNLLLCGLETHVCIAQSAFDLLAQGFNVFVCVDAVGSRNPLDHDTALRRMENSGVVTTTTEAVLFEWCVQAGSDAFKGISNLVRSTQPE